MTAVRSPSLMTERTECEDLPSQKMNFDVLEVNAGFTDLEHQLL